MKVHPAYEGALGHSAGLITLGHVLRLFDTARQEVADFIPRDPGRVSIYVCGPTVYDVPHIGHGRFVLVFDVLRRYLEWSGYEVQYVSNITDVDDKIINRANVEGRTPEEVANEFEAVWYDSLDQLGVRRPTADPHASQYVERMVDLIGELMDHAYAYETSNGVYFNAEKLSGYGLLAGQSIESLQAGARVEVLEEKRSPIDFALWKRAKPREPSWPSPWGPGRPGWHTECVVMSLDLLGEGFDLHGGGQDLQFPHHENERAQAQALGKRFAAHWMHNGFVEVGGEKMSKSLGNFTSLTDLLSSTDARAYRLLVLQSHYRSPIEVTRVTAEHASRSLVRLDDLARRASDIPADTPDEAVMSSFRQRMEDDLDTPGAVALVFDAVRDANSAIDDGNVGKAGALVAAIREIARVTGLELRSEIAQIDPQTADLIAARDAARRSRDFIEADAIRDKLAALGWVVEDGADGTKVHR